MTNQEFLAEALAYEGCPESFREDYAYFCSYQALSVEMLKDFVRICTKHDIHYTLCAGSALGVVRDGGQIPWDYDVDVYVLYNEKEKLYRALDQDLDSRFYYCAPEKDPHYRPHIIRIVPKGYVHQAIHVDVFFLIGVPDNKEERDSYCKEIRERDLARRYVAQRLSEYPYPLWAKLHQKLLKYKYLLKFGRSATGDNSKLFNRYDIREVSYVTALTEKCGNTLHPKKRFLEPDVFQSDFGEVFLPNDHIAYLQMKYGDWKQYLPIEKRIREVEKHCRLFRWYEKRSK